jgi:hypothetical protein
MKGLKRPLFFTLVVLVLTSSIQAQQGFFNRSSFGSQFHYGSFLTSAPKAVYVRDSYSYFGELYFQQPAPKATKPNHQLTQWGAGLFFGHTGSKKYIGKMAGTFAFIKMPMLKYRAFKSDIRLGAGLGWIEKPYDVVSNHKNVIIGSSFNGYINALWQNELSISKNVSVNAGLSFSHLSNGSSTLPNLGLNIPALSLGVCYTVHPIEYTVSPDQETTTRKWTFDAFTSVGIKQIPWIGSKRYLVNVASLEAAKSISFRSSIGGGAFFFYDRTYELDQSDIYPLKRDVSNAQGGIYALYKFQAGRVTLPVQVGIPLVNRKANEQVFQQVGVRYNVSKKWTGQVLLKTFGGKADLIHLGIGYKIR